MPVEYFHHKIVMSWKIDNNATVRISKLIE